MPRRQLAIIPDSPLATGFEAGVGSKAIGEKCITPLQSDARISMFT
jgi:hypothetical protein